MEPDLQITWASSPSVLNRPALPRRTTSRRKPIPADLSVPSDDIFALARGNWQSPPPSLPTPAGKVATRVVTPVHDVLELESPTQAAELARKVFAHPISDGGDVVWLAKDLQAPGLVMHSSLMVDPPQTPVVLQEVLDVPMDTRLDDQNSPPSLVVLGETIQQAGISRKSITAAPPNQAIRTISGQLSEMIIQNSIPAATSSTSASPAPPSAVVKRYGITAGHNLTYEQLETLAEMLNQVQVPNGPDGERRVSIQISEVSVGVGDESRGSRQRTMSVTTLGRTESVGEIFSAQIGRIVQGRRVIF